MAQHDYDIANQSGSAFRADLNNALQAIVTNNSGASAPSTTYAHQLWIDTSTTPATIKRRDASNAAWITVGSIGSTAQTFWGAGAERMRIESWVDTFSSSTDTLVARSSSAAGTTNFIIRGTNSATSTADGSISFQVATNGNVTNTNNSYGAISDVKLKENIVDANSQWSDIKALQVRKYNFKEGEAHTQIGLIAQEVEQVSPGLVTEAPDRDADGNDLGTFTKSVNYSVLYMKAVKALQEAMERIEALEAKVAALEAA